RTTVFPRSGFPSTGQTSPRGLCTERVVRAQRGERPAGGPYFNASNGPLLELAALPLAQTAPDAEALVVCERVLQAFAAHVTGQADFLGLASRPAFLRKERFRVCLCAQRTLLPAERTAVVNVTVLHFETSSTLLSGPPSSRLRGSTRRRDVPFERGVNKAVSTSR